MTSKPQVPVALCLMGPTASGKTDLALELAQTLDCEIISVDSGLIYRGMNIGTAKPDDATLALVPHHLIDIRDPSESYSAADFRRDALQHMAAIVARGRMPMLVGGTMLYFKVLRDGIAPLPAGDDKVRARIQEQADKLGWPALHDKLKQIDPQAAAKIHPNNPQRLMRALEVYELTGVALGVHWQRQHEQQRQHQKQHQQQGRHNLPYRLLNFAIAPSSREELHRRIALRFEQMLQLGFEAEVRQLYQRSDLQPNMPSIRSVGYRQMWQYLAGECCFDEMRVKAVAATRQLAKRQFTWLRGWPELEWLDTDDRNCSRYILKYLKTSTI